jgi:glycerol-3-phosphate dehydrogenase
MIAVIGACAMSTALAILHARAGLRTALLGTRFDDATIKACAAGRPHPALGITLDSSIAATATGSELRNAPSARRSF